MQRCLLLLVAAMALCLPVHAQVTVTYDVQTTTGQSVGTFEHSEPAGTGTFKDPNGNATWQGKRTSPAGANPTTFADPVSGIVVIITSDGPLLIWEVFFPNGGYETGYLVPQGSDG